MTLPAGLDISIGVEADLPAMRSQYEFATLDAHMMVAGELYLRCSQCGVRPVPHHWSFAALCDPCLDERIAA